MKIGIIGTGHTKFGILKENIDELMFKVCNEAINDSGLEKEDIDLIYIANFSSSFANQCSLGSVLQKRLKVKVDIVRVESACASGGFAVKQAFIALKSGMYKNVLVVGVEKMSTTIADKAAKIIARAASEEERDTGSTFPSLYALMAQDYFHKYKVDSSLLFKVACKNHNNAYLNKLAHFHKKISLEEYKNTREIASPLNLFDCSPLSDGAAAILFTSDNNLLNKNKKTVYLLGIGSGVDSISLFDRKDLSKMTIVSRTAKRAYEMAKLKIKDIDFAELHDCFTIAEVILFEDIGFCEKGKAAKFYFENKLDIDGAIPINPSGGLKAKGHPIGATGVSQIVEIKRQINYEAEKRQVKKADIGLACNIGGIGSSCVISIWGDKYVL